MSNMRARKRQLPFLLAFCMMKIRFIHGIKEARLVVRYIMKGTVYGQATEFSQRPYSNVGNIL